MSIHFQVFNPNDLVQLARDSASAEQQKRQLWLNQYYDIRQQCFRKELGLSAFDGAEDINDRTGYILLAIEAGCCVGGARLNSSSWANPARLPLEQDGFNLMASFPALVEPGVSYCQWTRLAVREECRSVEVINQMAAEMVNFSVAMGHTYSFNVTGSHRARFYRRLHTALGFNCEIREDIGLPVPDNFQHLEHLLSVVYLRQESASAEGFQALQFNDSNAEKVLNVA